MAYPCIDAKQLEGQIWDLLCGQFPNAYIELHIIHGKDNESHMIHKPCGPDLRKANDHQQNS